MDAGGDPAVEDQLDGFSLWFPLPYRVAIIVVMGAWAWGLNLHYLHVLKIDVPKLIRYPPRPSHAHPPHYSSTYNLATLLTIPLASSLLLFWLLTHGSASRVLSHESLPNLTLLSLLIILIIPVRRASYSGRFRFLTTFRRIAIGNIALPEDGRFGDLLLADVLTSYAKVLGDLFVALCMMFSAQHSTAKPDRSCGGWFVVPFLIAVPSLIRLRQCLVEFGRVRAAGGVGGAGLAHLANALKYSTAFPVIILSAMQRGYDPASFGMSEAGLFRMWLVAVFVNSFYSFYWDVAKDWDLPLFGALAASFRKRVQKSRAGYKIIRPGSPEPGNGTNSPGSRIDGVPYGLRKHRYIHAPSIYYAAVGLDLLLRCTWSFKLSPHLDHFNDLEGGIFFMEALEVFRRWVWIFLRVETEWVRSLQNVAADTELDVLPGTVAMNSLDD